MSAASPLRDALLVAQGEEIVEYVGRVELRDGPDYGHVKDVQRVARTEYVRPEKQETFGDFLLALGVMGLLVLAGFAWFAVASASQAVPHV